MTQFRKNDYPIPDALNATILFVVLTGIILSLLYLGTNEKIDFVFILVTLAYPLLFICNYSLIHEACHNNLNSNESVNYALGRIATIFFPMPFSILHKTHIGHHLRNRTDHETFDLYLREESLFKKRIYWYSLLLGFHYIYMVTISLAIVIIPDKVVERIAKSNEFYAPFASVLSDKKNLLRIRLESLVIIVTIYLAVNFLSITQLMPALFLAVVFWSSNQYLPHFHTNRDIIEGACNLSGVGPLGLILLHREYDLVHHRYPEMPWVYLPRYHDNNEKRTNYFKQWFRQWKGPILTNEKSAGPITIEQLKNKLLERRKNNFVYQV